MASYSSSEAVDTNKWTHIAVVVDKTNELVRFYKDNVLINITSAAGLNLVNNANELVIGKNPGNEYFTGMLDDVRVYDTVLTKTELQNIYNEKLDKNLILHYDFEKYDYVRGEVYDESIYGNDGILMNKETEAKDFTKEIGNYALTGTAFNADVDQYIRIPTTAENYVQGTNLDNCTMTAWVKTDKLDTFEPILHKDGVFSFGLDYGHVVLQIGDGETIHALPAISLMDAGMQSVQYMHNFDQPARSLYFGPNAFAYNKYFSAFRSDESVVDADGLVTAPSSASVVPKTYAFWMKGIKFSDKYYSNFSIRVRRDDNGTIQPHLNRVIMNRVYLESDRFVSMAVNISDTMTDGKWHHHILTYDTTKAKEDGAKYYLDGVEVGSGLNNTVSTIGGTNIGDYSDMGIHFNKLLRGHTADGLNQKGDVDHDIYGTLMENEYYLCEFAYWNNKFLTQGEATKVYEATLGTLVDFQTVPSVYYSFANQDFGKNKGTYHEKYSLHGFNLQLSYDIPESRKVESSVAVANKVLDPPSEDNLLATVDFNDNEMLSNFSNNDFEFTQGYYDGGVALKINENQHFEIDGNAFSNVNMNTMTFNAWVKADTVGGTQPILSRYGEENTVLFSLSNDTLALDIVNRKGPGIADVKFVKRYNEQTNAFSLDIEGYVSDHIGGKVYVVAIKNQYANTERVLIDYVKANVASIKTFGGGLVRTYFKANTIDSYLTTHTSAEANLIMYDSDFYVMVVTIDNEGFFDVYYKNNKDIHTSDYDPKLSIDGATGLFDGEKLQLNFAVTSNNEVDVMVSVHNKPLTVPYNFEKLDTVSGVSGMGMSHEVAEVNYTTHTKIAVNALNRLYVYIELVNNASGQRMSEEVIVDNVSVVDTSVPYVNIIKREFNEAETSMSLDFSMYSSSTRIVRYYVANFVTSTKQMSNDAMYINIITNKDTAAVKSVENIVVNPFIVSNQSVTMQHGLSLETNSVMPLAPGQMVDTRVIAVDEVGKFFMTNSFETYVYYENFVYNSVYTLGLNNYGQLGDGTTTNQTTEPMEVLSKYNVIKMATGYRYTMFVTGDNELYGMGYNNYGQIGTGNASTVSSPVRVLENQRVKDVVCGYRHTVVLTTDGKVFVMGYNGEGILGTGSTTNMNRPVQTMASHKIKFITASYQNSFFVTEDNRVFGCGRGSEGQIGDGANSQRNNPVEIVIPGEKVVEVFCTTPNNSITTYFRTLRQQLYSTGYNGHGQIGNGTTTNINTPFRVPMEQQVKRVACGDYHTMILDVNNRVFGLGLNDKYQLGWSNNTTTAKSPVEVMQNVNVRRIECGIRNTFFVTADNELYAVGQNTYSTFGRGNNDSLNTPTKVELVGVDNLVGVENNTYGEHAFYFSGMAPETTIVATEAVFEDSGALALKGSLNSGVNKNVEYCVFARTTDTSAMTDAEIDAFVVQYQNTAGVVLKGTMATPYSVVDLKKVALPKVVDTADAVFSMAAVNFASVMLYMKLEDGAVIKQALNTAAPAGPKLAVSKVTYDALTYTYQTEGSIFVATDSVSSYYLAGFDFDTSASTDADLKGFAISYQGDAPVVKVTQTVAQGAVFAFSAGVPALFADISDNTAVTAAEVGTNVDIRVIVTMASDSSTAMSAKPMGDYVSVRDVDWSQETANTPDYDLSSATHNITTNGYYGRSCSISADGKTMLLAGSTNTSTGGAFVWDFNESTSQWGNYDSTGSFTPNVPHDLSSSKHGITTNGHYGLSCSISADGKTALIAGQNNTSSGGAFIWEKVDGTWTYDSNKGDLSSGKHSITTNGNYGQSCSLSADGKTAIIAGSNNTTSGGAFVWEKTDDGTWKHDSNKGDLSSGKNGITTNGYYGASCAMSGDGKTLIVAGNASTTSGGAFIWERSDNGTWTHDPTKGDLSSGKHSITTNGNYGYSCALSIDGKTALIAGYKDTSSGGAFIWKRSDNGTWTYDASTGNLSLTSAAKGYYGHSCSVSADGTTALICGYINTSSGGAWLWTYDGSDWIDTPFDLSKDASTNGQYGAVCSLSADGLTALVSGHSSTSAGGAWIWRGIDDGPKSVVEYTPAPEIPFVVENNAESLLAPHIHDVYFDETKNKFIVYGSLHSALDNASNNVYAMGFAPEMSGNKKDFAIANVNTLLKKVVSVQKNNVEFFSFELPLSAYDDLDDASSTVGLTGFSPAEFRLVAVNGSVTTISEPKFGGASKSAVAMHGVDWDGVTTAFQTVSNTTWSAISGDGMRMVRTKNIGSTSGSMYVYEYNAGSGQYDEVFSHTMEQTNGHYGGMCQISVDGNSIIVAGAKNQHQGCAFVWQYEPKTKAWGRFNADGSHTAEDPHDLSLYTNQTTYYGRECAIAGDGKTVCIGGYYNNYHGEIYVMHYDEVSARWGTFSGGSFSTSYDASNDRYNIRNSAHYHRDATGYVSGHVQMGRSMDLSGDGSVMVFGMYRNDVEHISSLTDNRIYIFNYNKETGEWGHYDANGGFINTPLKYHRRSTSDTGRYGQHVAVSANGKVITVCGENSTSGRSWIYHYSDEHAAWGMFLPDGTFVEGDAHIYAASSNGNYPQRTSLSADGRIAYFVSSGSNQGGIFAWQYNEVTHNWGHYTADGSFVPDQFKRVPGEFNHMSVSANGLFVAGRVSSGDTLNLFKANDAGVVDVVNFGETVSKKAIYVSKFDASLSDGKLAVKLNLVRPPRTIVGVKVFATTNKGLSASVAVGMSNDTVKEFKESYDTAFSVELDKLVDVNGTVVSMNSVGEVDLYAIVDTTDANAVVPNSVYKKAVVGTGVSTGVPFATVTALYERADDTVAVQGAVGSVYGTTDKLYMVAFENKTLFDSVTSPEDLIVSKYDAGSSQVVYQSMSIARYAVQKVEFTLAQVYTDAAMTTTAAVDTDKLGSYDVRILAVDSTNATRLVSAPFEDIKAVVYTDAYAVGRNNYYQLGNFYNGSNMSNSKRVLKGYDIVDMSMGENFTVFLTAQGDAYGYGYNNHSQLGTNNTTNYYYHPYKMLGDVKMVECGQHSTMLLKKDGTVFATGYNGYGQLATGNTTTQKVPVQVMTDVMDVARGDYHTLFLKKDGTLFVCGYNNNGQLGRGNTSNVSTPVQVTTSAAVKAVFGGYRSSFYITVDDEVFGFGLNSEGQLGLDDNTQRTSPVSLATTLPTGKVVSKISQGTGHTMFLMTDGTLYTTGRYNEGQLGLGSLSAYKKVPELVNLTRPVIDIAAYKYGSYAVYDNNILYASGRNSYNELGDGTTTQRTTFGNVIFKDGNVKVEKAFSNDTCDFGIFLSRHTEASIALSSGTFMRAAPEVSLEVKAMGTPMTWYVMASTSQEVATLASVKQAVLAPEARSTVFKKTVDSYCKKQECMRLNRVMSASGPAPAYGVNFVRVYAYAVDQANNEFFTTHDIVFEEQANKPHGVLTMREAQSAGGVMTEALGFSATSNVVEIMIAGFSSKLSSSKIAKARNMVVANKETSMVHLSSFSSANKGSIVQTSGRLFTKVFNGDLRGGSVDITPETAINTLDFRVITVDDVGNVMMSEMFYVPHMQDVKDYYGAAGVGSNSYSQLAIFSGRGNIRTLQRAMNMRTVAKGNQHTVYVDENGSLFGVGYNNYGQLGTGNTTTQYTPVGISVSNVKKVACGQHHSMFLTHDGKLYGCGYNGNGQLGDGTTSNRSSVVRTLADFKIIDVACGANHTVVVTENYDVFGCGNNGNYQLATYQSNSSRNMLTQSSFDEKVKEVHCGYNTTIFVTTDNRVFGVGTNSEGQLGDGTTSNKTEVAEIFAGKKVVRVSMGDVHTAFVTADLKVFVCGRNTEGQLGDGTTSNKSSPTQVMTTHDIADVFCGYRTIFFRTTAGKLYATGYNNEGQLGLNDTTNRSAPEEVPYSDNVWSVTGSIYHNHTIFRRAYVGSTRVDIERTSQDRQGLMVDAEVSVERASNMHLFVSQVGGLTQSQIQSVVDAKSGVVSTKLAPNSLKSLDDVRLDTVLDTNNTPRALGTTASAGTVYAYLVEDEARAAGYAPAHTVNITVTVDDNMKYAFSPAVTEIKAGDIYVFDNTAAGSAHPLRFTGSAAHPGMDGQGILFNNDDTHVVTVSLPKDTTLQALYAHCGVHQGMGSEVNPIGVAAGGADGAVAVRKAYVFKKSLAIKRTADLPKAPYTGVYREIYAVGRNNYYHMGTGDNSGNGSNTDIQVPVPVFSEYSIADMRVNHYNSAFITDDARVFTDGHNNYGQLGNGTTTSYKLTQAMAGYRVKQVELSHSHTAFVTEDGKAFMCGRNNEGYYRLCTGDQTNYYTPVQVLNSYKIKQVAIGYQHTMFLTEEGEVFGGGRNDLGNVGNDTMGNTSGRILRAMLPEGMKVAQIECAKYSTFFRMTDGSVYATGYNDQGEIGVGSTSRVYVPEKMQGLGGQRVIKISAGFYTVLALTESGQMFACGRNNEGQVGRNPSESNKFTVFTSINTNNRRVIDITAVGYSSFFVTEDYEAYGFGYNNYGQLGDHSKFNRYEPYQVRCDGKKIGKVFGGMYDVQSAFFGIVDPDQKMSVDELQIDRNLEDEVLDVSAKVEAPFDAPATYRVVATTRLDALESEAKSLANANKGSRAVLTVPLVAGTSKTVKLPLTHMFDASDREVRSATAGAVRVFAFVDRDGSAESVVKSEVFAIPSPPPPLPPGPYQVWVYMLDNDKMGINHNNVTTIQMYDVADAWPGSGGIEDEYGNRISYSVYSNARRTDIGGDFANHTAALTSKPNHSLFNDTMVSDTDPIIKLVDVDPSVKSIYIGWGRPLYAFDFKFELRDANENLIIQYEDRTKSQLTASGDDTSLATMLDAAHGKWNIPQ